MTEFSMQPERAEVLNELQPLVEKLIFEHRERHKPWTPSQLLFPDVDPMDSQVREEQIKDMQEQAHGIPEAVLVVLVLNSLTEAGLPHFHRLLAVHLGNETFWNEWTDLWTAEEDRHDGALHDFLRYTWVVDVAAVERLQRAYLETGFRPDWGNDPFQLLAYTTIQEEATQIAHRNVGKATREVMPLLNNVLGHIAGEEGQHAHFYREVFGKILTSDPNNALEALWKAIRQFYMPGASIPDYNQMAEIAGRLDIFGPVEFGKIIARLIQKWNLSEMAGLNHASETARDKIMEFPGRLQRAATRRGNQPPEVYTFDFLPEAKITV